MSQFDASSLNLELRTLLAQQSFLEKRQHERRECTTCIAAVPLDDERLPAGPMMIGHCINISDGGVLLSLLHSFEAAFLHIEPVMETSELHFQSATLEVLRRTEDGGCWMVAGRFV